MFAVLDTNHYDELTQDSPAGRNARRRIVERQADVFISIVSVQESAQGWLALINRKKPGREQLHAYARFQASIETLTKMTILPFDEPGHARGAGPSRDQQRVLFLTGHGSRMADVAS